MNVTTKDYFYLVSTPVGTKFAVYKDKRCTCGKTKCFHVEAVALYLKMGGRVALAPDAPKPVTNEEKWAQRVGQLREKRIVAIASGEISDTLKYFLELYHCGDTFQERIDFHKRWNLPYEVIDVLS